MTNASSHIKNFLSAFVAILLVLPAYAQQSNATAQNGKKIEIINANSIEFDKALGPDVKKLVGNVLFEHNNSLMNCDSAYFFSERNIIHAYSNVHINRGDTVHLYGDTLRYNGNERMARVRSNVRLVDRETVLITEYLDFDIENDFGYYINGGNITSGENRLSSNIGYYYAETEVFFFRDSVVIINPDYYITSDTLKYNTITKISYFFGPTEIISDENYIYCENGWYDTQYDVSQFNKNAYFKNSDQLLKGDSLYYERNTGLGKAFKNVLLYDSVQQVILTGHFAEYFEDTERAVLTDSAAFIQVSSDNDSLFVHADTLRSVGYTDSVFTTDSVPVFDSLVNFKIIKAYYGVRIFENELQGMCDSMAYSMRDSVIRLFGDPALWSAENQLTAEYMELHTKNNKPHILYMQSTAFIVSEEDTSRYNQIKGKNMTGFFSDNKLYRINVDGNSQSIHYAKDDEEVIGINKSESSNIVILLEDQKVSQIKFLVKPDQKLHPPGDLPRNEALLKDFKWLKEERPQSKFDIFRTSGQQNSAGQASTVADEIPENTGDEERKNTQKKQGQIVVPAQR